MGMTPPSIKKFQTRHHEVPEITKDLSSPIMTAGELSVAPILSTPAENLFEYSVATAENDPQIPPRSDDELCDIYEIARTAKEIREGKWRRIALQFPDSMLKDAPRVAQLLGQELASLPKPADHDQSIPPERIHILADTSYSSCCVDEIAAEHVHADVVVHYGRSCLSPTCRLPVIYVFTHHQLDHDQVLPVEGDDVELAAREGERLPARVEHQAAVGGDARYAIEGLQIRPAARLAHERHVRALRSPSEWGSAR